MFDGPNLVSSAGLVPVLALAGSAGLQELATEHLTVLVIGRSGKQAGTSATCHSPGRQPARPALGERRRRFSTMPTWHGDTHTDHVGCPAVPALIPQQR